MFSIKPSVHKQKPRRVQLFKKADWPKLKTTYRNKRIDISIIKTVLQLNEPVTNSDDFNVGGEGVHRFCKSVRNTRRQREKVIECLVNDGCASIL